MRRTRAVLAITLTAITFVGLLAGGYALAGPRTEAASGDALGPGTATVHLTIQHSRFLADGGEQLRVRAGTTVHFAIDNLDPIGHEFIIGDDEIHRRHEAGTEPVHPPRPGEVSIAALSSAETTFTFTGSTGRGDVLYACHLPGHFRFGMSGTIEVVAE